MSFEIREYLEDKLTRFKESAGSEITGECPECGKYGGFYANVDSGAFVCFKCDFKGKNAVGLVARIEGIEWSEARAYIFKNSVQLRRKSDIFTLQDLVRSLRPDVERPEAKKVEPMAFDIPKVARELDADVLRWLRKKRKVQASTAEAWELRWCRFGRYAGRLIIPIRCPGGYSFTARDMTGTQEPKYLNPTGADHRRLLIGWHCTPLTGDLVLCEGPFDAIRLWQNDVPALALGGKELHQEQLDMLAKLPRDVAITIMLDPEEETAPYKVADKLSSYFRTLYIAKLPDGIDPGDASKEVAQEAVDTARKWTGSRQDLLQAKLRQAKKQFSS